MNIHRFELMDIAGSVARAREEIAEWERLEGSYEQVLVESFEGSKHSLTLGDLRRLVDIAERYTDGRV